MNEVLFNPGILVKYYYDKIFSTAMSNSLGDLIDESVVSQKEGIRKIHTSYKVPFIYLGQPGVRKLSIVENSW